MDEIQQIWQFALLGLGIGALIAGIALAVVLFYRGSGVINLASGGIAMFAGYTYWALRTGLFGPDISTAPALVITFAVIIVFAVAMELLAFRPLQAASPLAKLAASLGVLLTLQASMLVAFGDTPKPQPPVLPQNRQVELWGAFVGLDRLLMAGIVIAAAAVLAALYRWTRFGLATRAASENEVSATLAGLSPNSLSMINTVLACLVAGGLGVLAASITVLYWQTLPLYIVPALAAALFARFTSFGIACSVGLLLGMAQSVLQFYIAPKSWYPTDHGIAMPGVWDLFVFGAIVVAMFWRGASLPGRGELIEKRLPFVPRSDHLGRNALIGAGLCAAALIALPWDFRQALIVSLLASLICLSYVVITGFVGQISVVQLALAGVAGYTVSHMAVDFGIEFPLAPLIAVAIATVIGLLVAVSALRVRGVSLAVVTLAAAVAIEKFGFANYKWGGGSGASPVPPPELFGFSLGADSSFRGLDGKLPSPVFGFFLLAVIVALCLVIANVRRSSVGRQMLAVRSNERAAAAAGVNVTVVKLVGFGLSAFIAGVAGVMYSYEFGGVSAAKFGAFAALGLIAFTYVGGITMISGAFVAGLISTSGLVSYALDKWFGLSGNWALLFARRRAYRHADHEPRGRRRRQLQDAAEAASPTTGGPGRGRGARGCVVSDAGSFPSPYEIETPPGCEGWEEMYPYYALFDERRRETDEQRFWFWNSMHFPLPMPAFDIACVDVPYQGIGDVAEPRLRRSPGHGHRLPGRQRLHLHLRQPGHGPGQDRRARGVLPEARGLLLRELGRAVREVEGEDGGPHRRAHRASRPGAARVRARRGRVRGRSRHGVRRGARGVRTAAALRRAHVAAPQRVPAARLRRLRHVRRLLQGQPPGHPRPAHRADGRGHRRAPVQARRRAQAARTARRRNRGGLGVRRRTLAGGDRRRARAGGGREGMAGGARAGEGPVVQHGDRRRALPLLRQLARRPEHPVRVARRLRAAR